MVETKQRAIDEAKENFVADLSRMCYWIKMECDYLKGREFKDEYKFLCYKAFVLNSLLMRLPLGLDHCPFCIENFVYDDIGDRLPDCSKCIYATTHEACQDDKSIYKILSNSKKLVRWVLSYLYAAKEPTHDDISQIIGLVDKIRSQLEYWEYRNLLIKKGKDWRDVVKGKEG